MSDQKTEKSGMAGFKPFIIIFVVLIAVMVLLKMALSAIM
jgi:hypothetical protein